MLARKALAGTAGAPKEYVEDVFSTYLYTGTGSAQTFTNNLDLSGEGGMVWIKRRDSAVSHYLADTERGTSSYLNTNNNNSAETGITTRISAFNNDGFSISTGTTVNNSGSTFASWSFRKAKKFFDVVTYTGNGTTQNVSHNLGSTPGCIIVKRTDQSGDTGWPVYHRSLGASYYSFLNLTNAASNSQPEYYWGDTNAAVAPTSTQFTVGDKSDINANGGTYVAYLFAHDAGGFGDAGSDSIIKCGSFTLDSGGLGSVTLDWEPQWLMIKRTDSTGNWTIVDNMRGLVLGTDNLLLANTSGAETSGSTNAADPTATGFNAFGISNASFIYIAIRRGPMKTPTSGTEVLNVDAAGASVSNGVPFPTSWPSDFHIEGERSATSGKHYWISRMTGRGSLNSTSTSAEATDDNYWDQMNGYRYSGTFDFSGRYGYDMRRAPGFFDVVCYTGTGVSRTVSHNLGVTPELMIVKARSQARDWLVYSSGLTSGYFIKLNLTDAQSNSNYAYIFGNDTSGVAPTSSVFTVGSGSDVNASGSTYVAYLFASVSGVSKVGSYTGDGGSQDINCGFTNGARFIIIRNVDDADNWRVYDTARGIVSGNDPYLKLESTAAEVTTTDNVDPYSAGFNVSGGTNTNGKKFIYLAIA